MDKTSLSYDFHIHSCLSPCGDTDMTPNNIAMMAHIKNLDVIALTDHNSCKNCPATQKIAQGLGITFICGMELTTCEEIHVVCLFPDLEKAMEWDRFVYDKLIKITNKKDIFGEQFIMDENDNITGEEENLLINATTISFYDCFKLCNSFGGIAYPAHIDKQSNSVLYQLGFIPDETDISCVEISDYNNIDSFKKNNKIIEKCHIITSSDAHYLGFINEPVNFIHPYKNTADNIISYLKKKNV